MAFNFDDLKKKTEGLAQKGADWAQLGVNKATQVANIAKLKAGKPGRGGDHPQSLYRTGETLLHGIRRRAQRGICRRYPAD